MDGLIFLFKSFIDKLFEIVFDAKLIDVDGVSEMCSLFLVITGV